MSRLLGVETGGDEENRWANGSRLGRTFAERTRSVNGFIFPTEKRGLTGNNHQQSFTRRSRERMDVKTQARMFQRDENREVPYSIHRDNGHGGWNQCHPGFFNQPTPRGDVPRA